MKFKYRLELSIVYINNELYLEKMLARDMVFSMWCMSDVPQWAQFLALLPWGYMLLAL